MGEMRLAKEELDRWGCGESIGEEPRKMHAEEEERGKIERNENESHSEEEWRNRTSAAKALSRDSPES